MGVFPAAGGPDAHQYLEQSTVDRAMSQQAGEAVICDLENKTEFQKVQIKEFEVPVGV